MVPRSVKAWQHWHSSQPCNQPAGRRLVPCYVKCVLFPEMIQWCQDFGMTSAWQVCCPKDSAEE